MPSESHGAWCQSKLAATSQVLHVWAAVEVCVVLGGSWIVIRGVISRRTIVITHIRGLITPLATTHEPPRC